MSVQLEHDESWCTETIMQIGGDVTIHRDDGAFVLKLPAYQNSLVWKPGARWHAEGRPDQIVARVQQQLAQLVRLPEEH